MSKFKQFALQKENLMRRLAAAFAIALFFFSGVSMTASARTTYRIDDGGQVTYHTTDATDPAEILSEAGLELGIDDTYTTEEGGIYTGIIVRRVQMITVNNGGHMIKTGTYGETVGELLDRLYVSVDEDDEISVDLTEETFDGMEIEITRNSSATETYTTAVPYETEYVEVSTWPEGYEEVVTAGAEGEMECTAQVVYENDQEIYRTVLKSVVTTEPTNQVVARGTGEDVTTYGDVVIGDGVIQTADGEILTYSGTMGVVATAYTCEGWGRVGITATGTVAREGAIAVDPSVIPYGTRMFIVTNDGYTVYGVATAEDTGHPDYITGNRVDLYYDTEYECIQFGVRNCTVYFLG